MNTVATTELGNYLARHLADPKKEEDGTGENIEETTQLPCGEPQQGTATAPLNIPGLWVWSFPTWSKWSGTGPSGTDSQIPAVQCE
jgi:hypothetical protein